MGMCECGCNRELTGNIKKRFFSDECRNAYWSRARQVGAGKIREVLAQAVSSDVHPVPIIPIDGTTYDQRFDENRLSTQYARVFELMKDGAWRTLAEISALVSGSEAGISARLRDYRKVGHTVERRRRGNPSSGLFEYRLIVRAA